MRFFIVFIVSAFVFCGCKDAKKQMVERNGNLSTIVIPRVIDAEDVNIFKNLEYTILEAKENSFLGYVSKLRVHQDKIYVLDARHAKSLFIYTTDGKHIATIGDKKGRGPLEFISVTNFEIDYANNQLFVIDNHGSKSMIYDLEGNFIKRVDSNIPICNAVLLPNGYVLHAKSSCEILDQRNFQILIADENKQIVRESFEYIDNKNLCIQIYNGISAQSDGGFNFAPAFRDTIYNISFESIMPKYAIDYGNNKKISKSKIDDLGSYPELFKIIADGNFCFMGNHIESKDFLYLDIGYETQNQTYVFYNKHTDNTIAIHNRAKIGKYEFELYRILCSDSEGYFYGAFNFTDVDKIAKLFPEIQKIDAETELNPVLFRYKVEF